MKTAELERRLPQLYLLFAGLLICLMVWVVPPFSEPDEPNQSCRAIALAHGIVLAQPGATGEAGAQIDSNVLAVLDGMNEIRMHWEKQSADFHDRRWGSVPPSAEQNLAGIRWAGQTVFVPFANTAVYPPWLYAPAILGWRMGEAANLTIFASLRLARLLCGVAAVLLGWMALRLAACSRFVLLPLLLLPSTLFLNAGCSQDAVLLSLAALATALLSRPLVGRRHFALAELAGLALLLAMCGTARPPYAALALVLFLPATELGERDLRLWMRPACGFVIVFAACGIWRHLVAPLGIEWSDAAEPETQQLFLREHPVAAAIAVARGTLEAAWDFLHRGLYVVGWNDLLPHHGAALVLSLTLLGFVLAAPCCALRSWPARGLLAVAIAGPLLGISLAEYVIWTPPGFHTVYGIQPRYWLPLLPLLMLLLAGRLRVPGRDRILVAAALLLFAAAMTLPWFAAHAFYQASLADALRLNLR